MTNAATFTHEVDNIFRQLTIDDADSLQALGEDAWWMKTRSPETITSLLLNPAMQIFGLYEDDRLIASAALLTDGVTKAVLVDVVVAKSYRLRGFGDEVTSRAMATLPDTMEGILYCENKLVDFYGDHGFAKNNNYSLMLRRK